MKLLGTIVTPGGGAYEVLGEELSDADMKYLTDGLGSGKAAFFRAPGYRVRPVGSPWSGLLTDEERAEAEKRAAGRSIVREYNP